MVTFFKDDMQNKMYTESFINNTRYYDSLHNVYEDIKTLKRKYYETGAVDSQLVDNIVYNWYNYAHSMVYRVSPIVEYFNIKDVEIAKEIGLACMKYQIPSYSNNHFFVNLYDIQYGIKSAGVRTVTMDDIEKARTDIVDKWVTAPHRIVIVLKDNNKLSRYIIARFKYSFGVFDTIERKIVSYKNFDTHRWYGEWNKQIELFVIACYNAAVGRYVKQTKPKQNTQVDKVKPVRKKIVATKQIKQPNIQVDKTAISDYRQTGNVNENNGLTQQAKDKLHRVTNNLSKSFELPKLDVDSYVTQHDAYLLNTYMKNNELEKFETVARKVFNSAFIEMVEHKDRAVVTISYEADKYYNILKNRHGAGVTNTIRCTNPRDREYRAPVGRGLLVNKRGESIDGGDNRYNQTQISIKMDNNDFIKLCNSFGISKPDQSQLNDIVESVLQQKFESYQQYTLSDKARLAVLYHRDSRKQSLVNKYSACYIPCEYNAYITKIQRLNYGTPNFKNSKSFVLSVILHEYIGYM